MKLKAALIALTLAASAATFAGTPADAPEVPSGPPPAGFTWQAVVVGGVVVGFVLVAIANDSDNPAGTATATGTR